MQVSRISLNSYNFKANTRQKKQQYSEMPSFSPKRVPSDMVSFKAVNLDNVVNTLRESAQTATTSITQKFENQIQALRDRYEKRKQNTEGIFKNLKIKKLEKEEDDKIKGFLLAQEWAIEEQDDVIKLLENQKIIMEQLNASEEDKIALTILLNKEKKAKQTMETMVKANQSKQGKYGFDSIAGYESEKFVLTDKFFEDISREVAGEEVKIPGAVLFYGPTGNGKTSFAKAFAEATNCELIPIRGKGKTKEDRQKSAFNQLQDLAEKAQAEFMIARKEDNTEKPMRKILLLDEFDGIANEQSVIKEDLKQFMETCSEDYHVTLFLTSNDPLTIDSPLRNSKRIPVKVFLDPPNKENVKSILKYYIGNVPEEKVDKESINYDELADKICSDYHNHAYNNSQLEEIMKRCCNDSDEQISQNDILYQINNMQPIISKEEITKYNEEKKVLNGWKENQDE